MPKSKNLGSISDSYGILDPAWNYLDYVYPKIINDSNIQNAWQITPIAFEVGGVIQDWFDMGYSDYEGYSISINGEDFLTYSSEGIDRHQAFPVYLLRSLKNYQMNFWSFLRQVSDRAYFG